MSKTKHIRVSIGFTKLPEEGLATFGHGVLKGLTGNPDYPDPPVKMDDLSAALNRFNSAVVESRDGGKKAILARGKHREIVVRMLRQLARYVELACGDDMLELLSSGFDPVSQTRAPSQPLSQPQIWRIKNGNSGQLLVSVTPVSGARSYELHYNAPGSATPDKWTTIGFTGARSAVPVDNLTPAMTYVFQVRALNTLGYTDWSDSVTRICT